MLLDPPDHHHTYQARAHVCGAEAAVSTAPLQEQGAVSTEGGDEVTGTHGGADDTMLPPGGWFPFVLIVISLAIALAVSKHLEKKGTPGGEYGVVDH